MSLIYTRSPFFIQSTSGDSTIVSLYVWNGNSSSVPSSAQYTLTKTHNSSGKATFEVSELIRDYVDQSFNGDYVTEAVWVYISMSVSSGGGGGTVSSDKYLATDGYIDEDFVQYWSSNSDNNLKSDEVLMSNDYISVPEDTTAVIPTKDADMAVFYKDGEVKYISELANKNLIDYSEDFSSWDKTNVSVSEEPIQPPLDGNKASKMSENSISSEHYAEIPFAMTSGSYSFSVFAKSDGNRDLRIRPVHIGADQGSTTQVNFDLSNGTINSSVASHATAHIRDFGGGWYRCVLNITVTGTITSSAHRLQLSANGNYVYTGDGSIGIYLWGAQVEKSNNATEYNASDSSSSGAINYATSAGQSASTFYARVIRTGGTIIDENCSDDIMEYVSELDIDEAHVIKSDGKVEVISVETLPCNKYENVRLTFVNKFGALQDIHFSAKTTESMSAKGSSYNSINFDYDNLSNNYGSHSVRDFNKNATVRHTLNTDYLHESYSEVFRQLVVSEEVWMEHKGNVRPVNVTTNSLQKKTHANNGLVQFTVSVKESHSLINNIR